MKKNLLFIILFFCLSCNSQQPKNTVDFKIKKSELEWKNELSKVSFYVLRMQGTEPPFSGKYNNNYQEGVYICAGCKTPLYESRFKYNSKSGWPSFDRGINENILVDVDYKLGYPRTELKCLSCGGHLGHLFNDGPEKTTGQRHCINSAALIFLKKNEKEKISN